LTQDGETFTEKNLRGKWSLVYFGFTNCPDICPQELDKMTAVLDVISAFWILVAQDTPLNSHDRKCTWSYLSACVYFG
jgi:peroxiredoxin